MSRKAFGWLATDFEMLPANVSFRIGDVVKRCLCVPELKTVTGEVFLLSLHVTTAFCDSGDSYHRRIARLRDRT